MKTLTKTPLLNQVTSTALFSSHINAGKEPDTATSKTQQPAV
ncbi:MAG: hypothetical protein ACI8WB_005208 [Phenylobacterium sp.]|jgi:hypothetical protein